MQHPPAPRLPATRRHAADPWALGLIAAFGTLWAAEAARAADASVQAQLPAVTVTGHAEGSDYRPTRSSTFTKTDTPLKDVPASITVVPATLMKDQAMQSLADVIRYVPGTTAHQGEGNRDQFVLRGISTTADLYVDGIRDDAQVFRDLYNLERVEVLKGTAGMVFGRGGAGGVLNRVTKRPVFGHVGEATLGASSQARYRGTLDVGEALNDSAAWRLNAVAEDGHGFRDGTFLRRFAINPTITLLPSAQTTLTLGIEHLQDDRTADRGVPSSGGRPFETDPATFFGNAAQSTSRARVDGAYATLTQDLGGGTRLTNALRITHYDKRYQNVFTDNSAAASVDAAGNIRLAAYNNANRRTNAFNQTDLTTKFATGGVEHTLLAGLELGRQTSTSRRETGFFGPLATDTRATVPAASPYAVATRFEPTGSDADNRVTADIAALYLQDQLSFGPAWKLLAGVRYDHFRTRFDDRRATTPPVDLARTDNAFSPRLGLIWSPTPGATYYASVSKSFLPSGEQLSLAPNTADLAPEQAVNYEVGARWDVAPALTASAAVFRLDRDDVRSPDPLNPGFFVKTGQQRTEGVELGLQGDITPAWKVHAGYAWLDGQITQTTASAAAGARLQLVPRNALSVWNRVDLGHHWGAGLGVVYQGRSYAALDNRVELPAFTRFDGAVYHAFAGGATRLALNIENLLDRRYVATADGNNNLSPGAPREARVTLTTAF